MEPYMSPVAQERLYKFLDNATNVFEYGAGGSTYQACIRPNVKSVHSVESDVQWADKVREAVTAAGYADKLVQHTVDLRCKPNNLGLPGPACTFEQATRYPRVIRPTKVKPDLVVVDGRFRVACCLHAWHMMDNKAVLLIDDYSGRPQYHIIEKHFEKIPGECDGRLVAFRRKPNCPPDPHDIKTHEMCAL